MFFLTGVPWSFLQASRHVLFCLCPPAFFPLTNGPLLHAWSQLSMPSVSRCPVCRYCQTPEPVEENKCFECGVQEVNWHRACLVLTAESSLNYFLLTTLDSFFSLSPQNLWICLICGHIGCGRYVSRHAYKHFEETQHTYAMQLTNHRVWDYAGGTVCLGGRILSSFPKTYGSKAALTTFGHQWAGDTWACGSPDVWICSHISPIDTQ